MSDDPSLVVQAFFARELRHDASERERWQRVLRWIDAMKRTELERAHAAIARNLDAHFAPEVRVAPPRWIREALRGRPDHPRLLLSRSMKLEQPRLDAEAIARLGRLNGLRLVTRIKLFGHRLDDSGAIAIVRAPAFAQLEHLNLTHNHLGPAGALALVRDGLPRLTHLYLGRNRIGGPGCFALASCPAIARLRTLDLRDNGLRPEEIDALREDPVLAGKELRLQSTN